MESRCRGGRRRERVVSARRSAVRDSASPARHRGQESPRVETLVACACACAGGFVEDASLGSSTPFGFSALADARLITASNGALGQPNISLLGQLIV